jgi:hypothetical protein
MKFQMILKKNKYFKYYLKNRGASISEILVACAIFSLLGILLFFVVRYSLISWRSAEDKTKIQVEMRKIQSGISSPLRSSSHSSVLVYDGDYRKTLAFKTFMDEDGKFINDDQGHPISQGFVLFTLFRPQDDPCEHQSPANTSDTRCYHKVLLRVDLTNNAHDLELALDDPDPEQVLLNYIPQMISGSKTGFSSRQITVDEYRNSLSAGANRDYVRKVNIIGRNLLSFDPEILSSPVPEVRMNIRGFRELEAGALMTAGESEDLTRSRFTIQVESSVIPMNR